MNISLAFNSPLEAGVRAVNLLVPAYPRAHDLQRLVIYDHLVVHSGDIGGPKSLHPRLPMRTAELLVRRSLVERGLLLMMSRGLIERQIGPSGISYRAGEFATTFLSVLEAPYLAELRDRAQWVANKFDSLDDGELKQAVALYWGKWVEQFQVMHNPLAVVS